MASERLFRKRVTPEAIMAKTIYNAILHGNLNGHVLLKFIRLLSLVRGKIYC